MNRAFFILSFAYRIAKGAATSNGNAIQNSIREFFKSNGQESIIILHKRKIKTSVKTVNYHTALMWKVNCEEAALVQTIPIHVLQEQEAIVYLN